MVGSEGTFRISHFHPRHVPLSQISPSPFPQVQPFLGLSQAAPSPVRPFLGRFQRDPGAATASLRIPSPPLPFSPHLRAGGSSPAPFPRIREPFPPFQPSSLSRIRSVPNLRTENPTLTTSSSLQNIRSPPGALLRAPPLGPRRRAPDNAGKIPANPSSTGLPGTVDVSLRSQRARTKCPQVPPSSP